MSDSSLNISGKIDSATVSTYAAVDEVATSLAVRYVVVGASARDIVLHHGHGAKVQRATADVDFGIQVPDWGAYEAVKAGLVAKDFTEISRQHRLISSDGTAIDIVPFGKVASEGDIIAWPQEGGVKMNILGFQEACDNAEQVKIQEDPDLEIPVATPEGMVLLKMIAWTDRIPGERKKDAKDIRYLLETYEKIPAIEIALYADQHTMDTYDADLSLAAAHHLGINAAEIAGESTYKFISLLLGDTNNSEHKAMLTEEMCEQIDREYERNAALLNALMQGFLRKDKPDNK
ncbi:MAG: nucleotidyl transferase AbiEii/AbiGii toxin family protein [Pseudomonadales bacterium]